MHLSRSARLTLRLVTAVVLAFVYVPLLVVVINSFNSARVAAWPPDGFTAEWWGRAWDNPGARAHQSAVNPSGGQAATRAGLKELITTTSRGT